MSWAEIVTQVSSYGTFDENRFSKALNTRLGKFALHLWFALHICGYAWVPGILISLDEMVNHVAAHGVIIPTTLFISFSCKNKVTSKNNFSILCLHFIKAIFL